MTDPSVEEFLLRSGLARELDDAQLDELRTLLGDVTSLARAGGGVRDLAVASRSMRELLDAARVFSPWHDRPKLTVFGSARVAPGCALYEQARHLAAEMVARGWMVVTGAGPGIMAAASEGAGRDGALGVNITLPFEQSPNPYVDADSRLVEMKYFFTRKVALTKESRAFAFFPGGIGTMDEAFEILTLIHTGKTTPAPLVLVDQPGGEYWTRWWEFMRDAVIHGGYLEADAARLVAFCHDVDGARAAIEHFYRHFRDVRRGDGRATIDLDRPLRPDEVDRLRDVVPAFAAGEGFVVGPGASVTFDFDGRRFVELRRLIDAINDLD